MSYTGAQRVQTSRPLFFLASSLKPFFDNYYKHSCLISSFFSPLPKFFKIPPPVLSSDLMPSVPLRPYPPGPPNPFPVTNNCIR